LDVADRWAASFLQLGVPGRAKRAGAAIGRGKRLLLAARGPIGGHPQAMEFSELERVALQLNRLYERLETRRHGRVWTTQELALGFVGDVGDLAKLIQAHVGVRSIEDCTARLGHELSDCLWSIIVLAHKCGIDLEAEFVRNMEAITDHVAGELER